MSPVVALLAMVLWCIIVFVTGMFLMFGALFVAIKKIYK